MIWPFVLIPLPLLCPNGLWTTPSWDFYDDVISECSWLALPSYFSEKIKGSVKLYFQHPQQLLSIFTDLEDENLKLIQECREEEGNLEKIRNTVREVSKRPPEKRDMSNSSGKLYIPNQ